MAAIKSMRSLSVAFIAVSALSLANAAGTLAGCHDSGPPHVVHRTFVQRDVIEPGLYPVRREPALYGWNTKAVEVPGPVVWHEEPAVYRTVTAHVRTPGGSYQDVERQVLVRPARRWAERTASVAYVHRRILLRPYRNIVEYQRPNVHWGTEHLDVRQEDYLWSQPDC